MSEEIYALAAALAPPSAEEETLLRLLCQGAEKALARQAGGEPCRETLLCAAAFLAAGGLLDSRSGAGNVERFTVGEVSVTMGGSAGGDRLRRAAGALMAPYRAGESFLFWGVRG